MQELFVQGTFHVPRHFVERDLHDIRRPFLDGGPQIILLDRGIALTADSHRARVFLYVNPQFIAMQHGFMVHIPEIEHESLHIVDFHRGVGRHELDDGHERTAAVHILVFFGRGRSGLLVFIKFRDSELMQAFQVFLGIGCHYPPAKQQAECPLPF